MRKLTKFAIILLPIIIVASAATFIVTNRDNKSLASTAGFQAGNIISDFVFTNKDSMSVGAIQNFLNSKVNCDTWGSRTSEYGGGTRAQYGSARGLHPPYTCLKDYTENGRSAAQIIYDIAQQFSINPQVLIVLLQKEQGLVTDEWPWPVQYRTATGYGCPDTAACDTQYYGFTNQVTWAARMFRAIMNNSSTWYTPYVLGNNFIRYSPDASCGGSNVYIQNRATQALYNYTPYQPNAGALAAGWGTAPCGAYGNRNFYSYFTDWFGSTQGVTGKSNAVYRVYSSLQSRHVLTGSLAEANNYVANGWRYLGIEFTSDPSGIPVYRLYSKASNSFYYTTDSKERDDLIKNGWFNDASTFKASSSDTDRPVFKLYSPIQKVFYFTFKTDEIAEYISAGWLYYDVAFYEKSERSSEVYRLHSNLTDSYFLTQNPSELADCISSGWKSEGVLMYDDPEGQPVYHLYSPVSKKHYYTTDTNEANELSSVGWKDGAVSFRSSSGGKGVYRLYNQSTNSNFFTNNVSEISWLTINGWKKVGVSFYSNHELAVRRLYNPNNNTHAYTRDMSLITELIGKGWVDHGISFYAPESGKVPVYQMCDTNKEKCLLAFTSSQQQEALQKGLQNYGLEFYASDSSSGREVTVFESPFTGWILLSTNSYDYQDYKDHGWVVKFSFFIE